MLSDIPALPALRRRSGATSITGAAVLRLFRKRERFQYLHCDGPGKTPACAPGDAFAPEILACACLPAIAAAYATIFIEDEKALRAPQRQDAFGAKQAASVLDHRPKQSLVQHAKNQNRLRVGFLYAVDDQIWKAGDGQLARVWRSARLS
jgi:hypothetical protein